MTQKSILLIENEWEVKKKLILQLTANDCEVIPTDSLFHAQRMLRAVPPQLIICSEHLPDGDALEFLNILRSSTEFSDLPLVVLAAEEESDSRKFTKQGATEVIHPSTSTEQLIKSIKHQLQIHLPGLHTSVSGITGQLHKLSITDLIFELAQRHGSGKITIDGKEEMAIFLKDGKIIHSRHGVTVGKKALYRCLRIADAAYQFQRNINDVEATIQEAELEHLVREAAMSNQKLMVNFHRYPSKFSRIKLVAPDLIESPSPKVKAALEIVRRHPVVYRFIDYLNLPDFSCYEMLEAFREKGVIELAKKEKQTTILVDNSCDLSPLDFTKHQVSVLPLNLKTKKETIPNRSVHSKNFLNLTRKDWEHYAIQPFTRDGFYQCFSTLNKEYEILTLAPSQQLLPTADTLGPLFEDLKQKGIEGSKLHDYETCIYPSRSFSIGYGLLTVKAASLAAENLPVELLIEKLKYLEERLQLIWIENQSGTGLLGKNQQHILHHWNGKEIVKDRKLGKEETVHDVFKQEINRRLDVKASLYLAVGSSHPSQTQELVQKMEKEYAYAQVFGFDITPVNMKLVGSHIQMLAFLQD